MKLLSLKQTAIRGADEAFVAASPTGLAAATIIFGALTIAAGYVVVAGRIGSFDPPRLMAGFIGAFLLLFAWMLFGRWKAARRPTNWIMRIRGSEVLIKFRSYENWRLSEDDVQVIELHRDEIAHVGKSTERQLTTNMDNNEGGVQSEGRVELEITLNDRDTSALGAALAVERKRPGWGGEHMRSKVLDYPVSVDDGVIRVTWRNQSTSVRPKIDEALARLGKIARVVEAKQRDGDYTPSALRKLGEVEQKQKLIELARRDRLAALRTVQELYKCSTTEASKRVEEFT